MNRKRKSGLQSGLSEIVARQTAPLAVNRSRSSTELLQKFKEPKSEVPEDVAPLALTVVPQTIVQQSTVVSQMPERWSQTTVAHQSTVDWQSMVEHPEQWTATPNEIDDRIMRLLNVYEQAILRRIYRLSWGFGSDTCRVGLQSLSIACNISKKQTQRSVDKLIGRGLIKRIGYDLGNRTKKERGSIFRILLPRARMVRQTTVVPQITVARQPTVVHEASNKEKALKENTHKEEEGSVGVRSRYSLTECRHYAESLKGQGITNPGGYAKTIYRTGEDDDFIAEFLEKGSASSQTSGLKPADSNCPLCHGSGMEVVKGKGARRCTCRTESREVTS